ncbi:hypothetical protein PABG_01289 [Paracoccidioides brasiliensis Pb03]|nr:hypothetical protein PABG_01289 [Paracoccidioides brasiliensis Pb03]
MPGVPFPTPASRDFRLFGMSDIALRPPGIFSSHDKGDGAHLQLDLLLWLDILMESPIGQHFSLRSFLSRETTLGEVTALPHGLYTYVAPSPFIFQGVRGWPRQKPLQKVGPVLTACHIPFAEPVARASSLTAAKPES